jgi:hypothetical protein
MDIGKNIPIRFLGRNIQLPVGYTSVPIALSGDENSNNITFVLDRYYNGIDLSEYDVTLLLSGAYIDATPATETITESTGLVTEVFDRTIKITWAVGGEYIEGSGTAQFRFIYSTTSIWHTDVFYVSVGQSVPVIANAVSVRQADIVPDLGRYFPIRFRGRDIELPNGKTTIQIGVRGDNNSNNILFVLDKTYNGIDLSTRSAQLVLVGDFMADPYADIITENTGLSVTVKSATIEVVWTVGANQTYSEGTGHAQIQFVDGTDVWNSKPFNLYVSDSLDADELVVAHNPSIITEIVDRLVELEADTHTHDNKSTLDAITSLVKAGYDAAVLASHTHSNKTTLDAITAAFTTTLKTSYDNAVTASHSHANKATLDLITAAFTTSLKTTYDNAVSALANKVDKVTGKGLSTNDFTNEYKQTIDTLSSSSVVSVNGETGVVVLSAEDVGAEPEFTKNTAFNKDFGTTSGTVCQGNDSRLSNSRTASDVYAWAKAANKPTYNATEVGAIPASQKGTANGVAELDSAGKVPSSQLPSYVDDVLEYESLAAFPSTGESGKIYVAANTNLAYRWTGSTYGVISSSLALGETAATAYRGDRGKAAYDHSQLTTGNPHGTTYTDVGAEPAIGAKGTAFNKSFGTGSNTVCEGNDARLSDARVASDVYAWAKAANKPTYVPSEFGLTIDWRI